jgi:phosphoglycolate phosphatase
MGPIPGGRVPAPLPWIEADAYLFDIDGTLLHARGRAHYNGFNSALKNVLGLDRTIDGVPWHGSTDIGILRAVIEREGLSYRDLESRLPELLAHMCAEVERNKHKIESNVCEGVEPLVKSLHARGKLLAVASGNLASIGWLKVEAAGLRGYFSFGAFSDSNEHRRDIFAEAILEARRRLGPSASVCVIGDTPADILAAQQNNIPVIAVATGIYTLEQLAEHRPDLCIRSCAELVY